MANFHQLLLIKVQGRSMFLFLLSSLNTKKMSVKRQFPILLVGVLLVQPFWGAVQLHPETENCSHPLTG